MNELAPFHRPSVNGVGVPHFFFAFDDKELVQFASESIRKVLGFTPSSVVGRTVTSFLTDSHTLNTKVRDCITHRFEQPHLECMSYLRSVESASDGSRILLISTWGVGTPHRKVASVHGMATDVTVSFNHRHELLVRFRTLEAARSELREREIEILVLAASGKQNKQIAAELGISTRTVEDSKKRITSRFAVRSFAEAISFEVEYRTLNRVRRAFESMFETCLNVENHVGAIVPHA